MLLSLCFYKHSLTQKSNYFDKNKEYHYNVYYINAENDTLTNEKIIFKPLGKSWFFQPLKQKAIKYVYFTDTFKYKMYVDPEDLFNEMNQRHYKKKGRVCIYKSEITGGIDNEKIFYLHPPRINQYRMLFYASHPLIIYDFF